MHIYTKEEYVAYKQHVQALLDTLLNLAKRTGLKPKHDMVVFADIDGVNFEIKQTIAFKNVFFFAIRGYRNEKQEVFLNMEYNGKKGTVNDSTSFYKNGKYDTGHIQCWDNAMEKLGLMRTFYIEGLRHLIGNEEIEWSLGQLFKQELNVI